MPLSCNLQELCERAWLVGCSQCALASKQAKHGVSERLVRFGLGIPTMAVTYQEIYISVFAPRLHEASVRGGWMGTCLGPHPDGRFSGEAWGGGRQEISRRHSGGQDIWRLLKRGQLKSPITRMVNKRLRRGGEICQARSGRQLAW